MYTNTPDEHFIVGTLAGAPHVVLLGGFSGHGYKMASVLGEIAAAIFVEATGRAASDLGMFAPERFRWGHRTAAMAIAASGEGRQRAVCGQGQLRDPRQARALSRPS